MANKDKNGNWIDAKGHPVPEKYIPALDKKRDALVEGIIKKVSKLSDQIAKCKVDLVKSIDAYLKKLAKDNRLKENWKGNIQLLNFAGTLSVERRSNDIIAFDERLQLVKNMVDKWLGERLQGTDDDLVKVITQAFNVDKQGRVNTAMLLKLLHLDIQDSTWKKAMNTLKESIIVKSTKTTFLFKQKVVADSGESWQHIITNLNDIYVEDADV